MKSSTNFGHASSFIVFIVQHKKVALHEIWTICVANEEALSCCHGKYAAAGFFFSGACCSYISE